MNYIDSVIMIVIFSFVSNFLMKIIIIFTLIDIQVNFASFTLMNTDWLIIIIIKFFNF